MKQKDFVNLKVGDKIWVWSCGKYYHEPIVEFSAPQFKSAQTRVGLFSFEECSLTEKEAIIVHLEKEIEKENRNIGYIKEFIEGYEKDIARSKTELDKIVKRVEKLEARLKKLQK